VTFRPSPLPGAARTGSGPPRPRAAGGNVIVLPFFQLRVEEVNIVRDAVAIKELVELLIVDPMGSLGLAV
jgi:hypothetical protein